MLTLGVSKIRFRYFPARSLSPVWLLLPAFRPLSSAFLRPFLGFGNMTSSSNNKDEVKERLLENRRKGHSVPRVLQERQGSASYATDAKNVPRLTHAERVKTLLVRQKSGFLATMAHEDGTPFGSIVNYAFDSKGELFFIASKLAEHTANLEKNPKGSLLVSEEQGEGDKLAVQRATVVGQMEKVEKTQDIINAFRTRHPAGTYVLFDDFYAFKFRPVDRARFIAGFGEMSWVNGKHFEEANPDPILSDVAATKNAITHMNADHADANVVIVNKFAMPPLPHKAESCTLLSIDRLGMDMLAISKDGKRLARVPFPKPLTSATEVKDAIIALTKSARL